MKISIHIFWAIFWTILSYLLGVFSEVSWNIQDWESIERAGIAWMVGIGWVIFIIIDLVKRS